MDKFQEMKEYLNQNQLRKVLFGGYSKEDVQMKFDIVQAMLDTYAKEQAEKEAAMLADFEKQIEQMQETNKANEDAHKAEIKQKRSCYSAKGQAFIPSVNRYNYPVFTCNKFSKGFIKLVYLGQSFKSPPRMIYLRKFNEFVPIVIF